MQNAADYAAQLAALKERIQTGTAEFVRQGYVTGALADRFLGALDLRVEDAETRAAREELEAFQARVREQVDATVTSERERREALRRFGL